MSPHHCDRRLLWLIRSKEASRQPLLDSGPWLLLPFPPRSHQLRISGSGIRRKSSLATQPQSHTATQPYSTAIQQHRHTKTLSHTSTQTHSNIVTKSHRNTTSTRYLHQHREVFEGDVMMSSSSKTSSRFLTSCFESWQILWNVTHSKLKPEVPHFISDKLGPIYQFQHQTNHGLCVVDIMACHKKAKKTQDSVSYLVCGLLLSGTRYKYPCEQAESWFRPRRLRLLSLWIGNILTAAKIKLIELVSITSIRPHTYHYRWPMTPVLYCAVVY